MFTTDNTDNYTTSELAALNAELAERLAITDPSDTEARAAIKQTFADEVARR